MTKQLTLSQHLKRNAKRDALARRMMATPLEKAATPLSKIAKLTPAKLQGWARTNRQLVLNMLAARLHAIQERARVDAYVEPLFLARGFVDEEGQPIASSKDLYRCEDSEACTAFYTECDAAHRAHGFDGPEGHCPALVAENAAIQAENVVLRSMKKLLGIEVTMLDHRTKLLDIIVTMIGGMTNV